MNIEAINLKDKKVLLTGPNSCLGRAVSKILLDRGANIYPIYHEEYDLLSYNETTRAFDKTRPDIVCAIQGYNGNILFNRMYPADIFYRSTQMSLNVLKVATEYHVKKIVTPLASCAFPNMEILKSRDIFNGEPDDSVSAHAFAKRSVLEYSRQIWKQYSIPSVTCVFSTIIGEWDCVDENKTKVPMGLIKRFVEASRLNQPEIEVWGSGTVRREFIDVQEAAEGLVRTLERYNNTYYPLNIGSGEDITIKDFVNIIVKKVNYKGLIKFNTDKPDGVKRKLLDSKVCYFNLGWKPSRPLEETVERVITWYENTSQ